ncbi:MAG: hypothetical protein AAFR26_02200 [Cyanobacteria bacterium J06626_4]
MPPSWHGLQRRSLLATRTALNLYAQTMNRSRETCEHASVNIRLSVTAPDQT